MKIQKISLSFSIVLISLLINASCSEFGNNGSSNNSGGGQNKPGNDTQTTNAFPADSPYLKPNDGNFTLEKMLVNVGTNLVYPATKSMSIQSQLLTQDLIKACASPATAKMESPEWQKLQAQWKEAMLAFHYMEAMSVGPLRKDDFGAHLYSWPYINLCGIDQNVVALSSGGAVEIDASPINVKGLGALEFLLFDQTQISSCNRRAYPQVAAWAEKSAEKKTQDRCQLAKELAKDLEKQSKSLELQWDPEQGNYAKTLVDGSLYKDSKAALTDLLHGLYAIEELKDLRLARPLGLSKDCSSEDGKCPEQAEHSWSGIAIDAMIAQTQGFHDAFFGSADESEKAFSFDDYLELKSYPEVSSQMGGVLYSLSENLKAVKDAGKFQDQITGIDPVYCKASTSIDRKVELCAIYQDAREITTILKTQILGIFSLEAPPGYQGDND